MKTQSYAAVAADKPLEHYEFERREPADHDVEVKILYSGICHSDIHKSRGDWGDVDYPIVTGHEIIGKVTRIGTKVTSHIVGDTVGVGVMVNSCGECDACETGMEQYCEPGFTGTYGAEDPADGSMTQGGYSEVIVVTEKFVLPIPDGLDIAKASPLLCAGITMYSPLNHWQAGPGKKVAIIGLGGLGHVGVKLAAAMGADVTVITTSPGKTDDAKRFGASGVIVSSSDEEMSTASRKFDLIIDTVPVEHDLKKYIELLAINGTICLVGPINPMPGFHGGDLIGGRKSIAGSGIGGLQETKDMLAFCAEKNVLPEVKEITIDKANDAWATMTDKSMSHRYVINMKDSF
jgi:uncharacterized zinc-type alcohol dehydrogenase-like protein